MGRLRRYRVLERIRLGYVPANKVGAELLFDIIIATAYALQNPTTGMGCMFTTTQGASLILAGYSVLSTARINPTISSVMLPREGLDSVRGRVLGKDAVQNDREFPWN